MDYCDVFISSLDSHSDGTHSLQRIHWWASNVMLHLSQILKVKFPQTVAATHHFDSILALMCCGLLPTCVLQEYFRVFHQWWVLLDSRRHNGEKDDWPVMTHMWNAQIQNLGQFRTTKNRKCMCVQVPHVLFFNSKRHKLTSYFIYLVVMS